MNDQEIIKQAELERDRFLKGRNEANNNRSTSQSIYSSDLLTYPRSNLQADSQACPPVQLISLNELSQKEFPPNRWVVDKLIPYNGITCISGKPKAGKSFLTLQLALCIATGAKYLDRFNVEQGAVLFITKEDPERLIQERSRLLESNDQAPIYFCTTPELYLDKDQYLSQITSIIKEHHIKVIVIDSFRRIFSGDENSSQVIADVHNRFKILLKEDISIIFIHHHGKEGLFKREAGDKLRGSSDILAIVDSLLMVERKDDKTLKIAQGALRSDRPIESFQVEFPDFEQNHNFKFQGYVEEEKDKQEQAEKVILELLETGSYNQKSIIEQVSQVLTCGPTTFKNALKHLEELGQVLVVKTGKEKFYSPLPDTTSLSPSEQGYLDLANKGE